MHVARRVCCRPGPVLKRCLYAWIQPLYFRYNRLLRWYNTLANLSFNHPSVELTADVFQYFNKIQWPYDPGAYTMAKKREKNERTIVKMQQAAAIILFARVPGLFFLKNQPTKKTKNRGKKTVVEATTVVPGIRITTRTLWTTTNKLEAGPAARGRDNEGQMRRSHVYFYSVLSRRATSPAPAQRKNCRYFSTWIRSRHGTTKKQISHFGDPQTGEVSY